MSERDRNPEGEHQGVKDLIKETGYFAYNDLSNGHTVNLGPLFGFSPKRSEAGPEAAARNVWELWGNMFDQLTKTDESLDKDVYGKDPRFNREVTPREHTGLVLDGMAKAARQRDRKDHLDVIGALKVLSAWNEDVDTRTREDDVERVQELFGSED